MLLIPRQSHHTVQMAEDMSSKQPAVIWHPSPSTRCIRRVSKASCKRALTACLMPGANVCQPIENRSSKELIPLPFPACGDGTNMLSGSSCNVGTPVVLQAFQRNSNLQQCYLSLEIKDKKSISRICSLRLERTAEWVFLTPLNSLEKQTSRHQSANKNNKYLWSNN